MVKKLICVFLILQLTGCGTILYPERKGQKSGTIDSGIAVLDAAWLLLFVVPGIVAYAADFYNGTIYLPGTSGAKPVLENTKDEIKASMQDAGQAIKSEGRAAAAAIRQSLQQRS